MKIVMGSKGQIIARHQDGDRVTTDMYQSFGSVLIGTIPEDGWYQDKKGRTFVIGSEIDVARDLAKQMARNEFEEGMRELNEDYPESERMGWGIKLSEARSFQKGELEESECIYLKNLAEAKSSTVSEIANSIIKKSERYAKNMATQESILGDRYKRIDSAKNLKKIIEAAN